MIPPRAVRITFNVPGRLKLGDSPEVLIRLDSTNGTLFTPAGARMTSVGLTVKPDDVQTGNGDVVDFRWIIGASNPGSTDARVDFFGIRFPGTQITALRDRGLPVLDVGSNYVLFRIEVTNALGLTTTQTAIFQAIGAVLGLFGVSAFAKGIHESWRRKKATQAKHSEFE